MSHTKSITLGKTLVERVKNNIDLDNETQKTCINTLYLTGECDIHQKLILSSLDNKISGYKNQDIKKIFHIYGENIFLGKKNLTINTAEDE